MGKQNCWEFKKCGREPGGAEVLHLGICPATTDTRLNGIHGGKNAGRACWVIAGTLCGGKLQGTFAMKEANCIHCDFYKNVLHEEKTNFRISGELLDTLK